MNMNDIDIQPLKEQIPIKFEQYNCPICLKKTYINLDDKRTDSVKCVFCEQTAKSSRVFEMEIKGIGEY